MKSRIVSILFIFAIAIVSVVAQGVPTPAMAMSWSQTADSRVWIPKFQGANSERILMEFVPKGDDINAWKELVIQQIDFTRTPLRRYIDGWKLMLRRADPKIKITEKLLPDGSYLMTFLSVTPNRASGELCVRRFIKGSDGIYQMAYSVRPALKNESRWKIWTKIVSRATLVPNPERGKYR